MADSKRKKEVKQKEVPKGKIIAKGGDPASLENLQLAHLQCNRIKATKLCAPQVKEKSVSNRDLPLSLEWSKAFNK